MSDSTMSCVSCKDTVVVRGRKRGCDGELLMELKQEKKKTAELEAALKRERERNFQLEEEKEADKNMR